MGKYKRVYVRPETEARIILLKRPKESAEDVIKRLLDEYDAEKAAGGRGPG